MIPVFLCPLCRSRPALFPSGARCLTCGMSAPLGFNATAPAVVYVWNRAALELHRHMRPESFTERAAVQ